MKHTASITVQKRPLSRAVAYVVLSLGLASAASANAAEDNQPQVPDEENKITVVGSYTTMELDVGTGLGIPLQETPQSATIMTSQRIEDQGLENLKDIVENIAGISSRQRDTERHGFAARGFDIENIQIDGVNIKGGFNGESDSSAAIMERVELVRGATGLLSGSGEPSAAINLVRKRANSDELTGSVSLSAGRWDYYNANFDVQTPLTEDGRVRARIVGDHIQSDSHRDNYSRDTNTFYAVVDADITDDTQIGLGVSRQENDPKGSTWGGLPSWFSDGSDTNWERSKTTGADWTGINSVHQSYFFNLSHNLSDDWTLEFNANQFDLTSDWKVIWWRGLPDRNTGEGFIASPGLYDAANYVTSYDAKLKGLYSLFGRDHEVVFGMNRTEVDDHWIGADPLHGDIAVGSFFDWDGSGLAEPEWGDMQVSWDTTTVEKGYFAATRLNMTDEFKVILGTRVSDWHFSGVYSGFPVDMTHSGEITPYAGALYDITDQHRVYTSYTEIFNPQTNFDRYGQLLDPKVGKSYEAGLKSRFMDGDLEATLAVFSIEQDNLAVTDYGHYIPGTPLEASRAVQGSESKGFELELIGEISPGWDLHVSYTDFSVEEGYVATEDETNPTYGVNTHQPRRMLKLFTAYNFKGDLNKLTLGGGVNWQSSTFVATNNPITGEAQRFEQDSYYLVNLMARYDFTPQLSAQLNVENLFDEGYYSNLGFYSQYDYGEPRNVRLKLDYSF